MGSGQVEEEMPCRPPSEGRGAEVRETGSGMRRVGRTGLAIPESCWEQQGERAQRHKADHLLSILLTRCSVLKEACLSNP